MLATITKPVMNEYEAQRQYLATANIGIVELVEKTMQMLLFVKYSKRLDLRLKIPYSVAYIIGINQILIM